MHYVAEIKIVKVDRKPDTSTYSSGLRDTITVKGDRLVTEVAHVTVKGSELKKLVERSINHLTLVEDDTEVQD